MPLTSQNDAENNALAANTQVLGDEQASAAFSELEPSRQILVFRSIQEALEADPPRPQARRPRSLHLVQVCVHRLEPPF